MPRNGGPSSGSSESGRKELPDLQPVDLIWAAGVASQLGKQLRSVNWRLRYGVEPREPKKKRRRKSHTAAADEGLTKEERRARRMARFARQTQLLWPTKADS
jgi:hypothetical protein